MNMDFLNIGKRLQETRVENNISQAKMARDLNIPINYISDLEKGRINIQLKRFMEICDFLNISIYDVLNQKSENIIKYMDRDLYELIIRCNIEKQRLIYNMVKLLIKNQVV